MQFCITGVAETDSMYIMHILSQQKHQLKGPKYKIQQLSAGKEQLCPSALPGPPHTTLCKSRQYAQIFLSS